MLPVKKSYITHSNLFFKKKSRNSSVLLVERELKEKRHKMKILFPMFNFETTKHRHSGKCNKNYINRFELRKIKFFNRPSLEHV